MSGRIDPNCVDRTFKKGRHAAEKLAAPCISLWMHRSYEWIEHSMNACKLITDKGCQKGLVVRKRKDIC